MVISKNGLSFEVNAFTGNFLEKLFRALVNFRVSLITDSFWDEMNHDRWENETFRVFDLYLDKRHAFIDVGAWMGPTLLYGCQLAGRSYGVEPDPVAYQILLGNVNLNPRLKKSITLFNGALAEKSGPVIISARFNFGDSMSWTVRNNSAKSVTVAGLTFTDFLAKFRIKDVNFINMDVEGAESVIVPSMAKYISRDKPNLLLSLHPGSFNDIASGIAGILAAVKPYRFIYQLDGTLISAQAVGSVLRRRKKITLLFTDREWPDRSRD